MTKKKVEVIEEVEETAPIEPVVALPVVVKFREELKISDVIERYKDDAATARGVSRVVVEWDLVDPYTGDPLPLPEPDTSEWYHQISYGRFMGVLGAWKERRDAEIPKVSGEQS